MTNAALNNAPASDLADDLAILHELQHYLLQVATPPAPDKTERPAALYHGYQSLIISTNTHDARYMRIAVMNREVLHTTPVLYWVGFFGHKKKDIAPEYSQQLKQLDRKLLLELEQYPFILSYNTLELPDRYNYGNLVLFSSLGELQEWTRSPAHQLAAKQISPNYYDSVRVHSGTLEHGLAAPFEVKQTHRYYF